MRIFAEHHEQVLQQHPSLQAPAMRKRLIAEIIRRMIHTFVVDLSETTLANLAQHQPQSVDEVRQCPRLAAFSPDMRAQADELKRFCAKTCIITIGFYA